MFLVKLLIAATVIAFCSWLAGKKPDWAGFIVALPLTTLLVLPFSAVEYSDPKMASEFAKSIFLAVLPSLGFFIPFFFVSKIPFGFWGAYVGGCLILVASYFIHQFLVSHILT